MPGHMVARTIVEDFGFTVLYSSTLYGCTAEQYRVLYRYRVQYQYPYSTGPDPGSVVTVL
jgi:hypothetical protein